MTEPDRNGTRRIVRREIPCTRGEDHRLDLPVTSKVLYMPGRGPHEISLACEVPTWDVPLVSRWFRIYGGLDTIAPGAMFLLPVLLHDDRWYYLYEVFPVAQQETETSETLPRVGARPVEDPGVCT
jgi:hypothetical protein